MTRARRERLITDNMAMVAKIARQVARKFSPLLSVEDFEQDGMLGLCEAARRCTRVTSFPAFAYFRIRGAMVDAHRRKAYRESLNPSLEGMAALATAQRGAEGPHGGKASASTLVRAEGRDRSPLPDALAARRELANFANVAIRDLPEDERFVISGALSGVKLAAIAAARHRSATWARAKLASARTKVTQAVAGRAA